MLVKKPTTLQINRLLKKSLKYPEQLTREELTLLNVMVKGVKKYKEMKDEA